MSSETCNFEEDVEQTHQLQNGANSSTNVLSDYFKISRNEGSFWDSPSIWQQDIPTLIDGTDLNVLVEYFAGVGESSGSSIRYRCPHPEHFDQHPSFSVATLSDGRERAKCWSQCGWHGDALDFIEWHLRIDTRDAIEWLTNWNNNPTSVNAQTVMSENAHEPRNQVPMDNSSPVKGVIASQTMQDYLTWRQWPKEVVAEFSLSVVQEPNGDLRIRHPFLSPDADGIWTASYWQDRSVADSALKWMSPKNGTSTLYNLQSLEREELQAVVICEGPADTISAWVALRNHDGIAVIGVPGAQTWRSEYAQLVQGLKIVVAADNDDAGRNLESAICASVSQEVFIARPTDGDITDTIKTRGIAAVRELLLIALNEESTHHQQASNR